MVKEIKFDELLEYLVTDEGKRYKGKRFKTITRTSILSYETPEMALERVMSEIRLGASIIPNADAYEIINIASDDKSGITDKIPYTASAIALLYKL